MTWVALALICVGIFGIFVVGFLVGWIMAATGRRTRRPVETIDLSRVRR